MSLETFRVVYFRCNISRKCLEKMFALHRFVGLHNELRFLEHLFFLLIAFTFGFNYQDIEA